MRVRPASAWAAFRPNQAAKRLCISASKLWRLKWFSEKESRGHSARSRVCRRAQKQSREDQVEVEVQFGLRAGLAIVEAQVLLGVAEGKLNWNAGPGEVEEVFRYQLGVAAVQQYALRHLRVGPAGQDANYPQPALPGLARQFGVVLSTFASAGVVRVRSRRSKRLSNCRRHPGCRAWGPV